MTTNTHKRQTRKGSSKGWSFAKADLQRTIYSAGPGILERPEFAPSEKEISSPGWIVTVYNNDYNTYEQVMTILMLATGCNAEEAYIEAWEIDHLGKSVVHNAQEEECRSAAEVIATIGIRVEVTQE